MSKAVVRVFWIGLFATLMILTWQHFAFAQNSLGVGSSEQAIRPSGPFSSLLFWIQQEQKAFYRSLTGALKLIRSGDGGLWLLVGLSFSYGVLHAAGPGHGKAVISSYMVANEVQLRRGVLLSFGSAALQAIVAIVMIGLLVFVLRGLGFKQAEFTKWLEVTSYLGVTLLGIWLLWKKLKPTTKTHEHTHAHHHAHGEVCSECGHTHMPDPISLKGDFGLREAWTAVFAVGLRPCTGALVVLTFSFLNGLYWAGILSAFAMALGTAITVAAIASLAVGAKNLALHLSGASAGSASFYRWIEIGGAVCILLLG
ncbi:MAG: nickel/cobalt transporter, partial [Salaquimonas sp.]